MINKRKGEFPEANISCSIREISSEKSSTRVIKYQIPETEFFIIYRIHVYTLIVFNKFDTYLAT